MIRYSFLSRIKTPSVSKRTSVKKAMNSILLKMAFLQQVFVSVVNCGRIASNLRQLGHFFRHKIHNSWSTQYGYCPWKLFFIDFWGWTRHSLDYLQPSVFCVYLFGTESVFMGSDQIAVKAWEKYKLCFFRK